MAALFNINVIVFFFSPLAWCSHNSIYTFNTAYKNHTYKKGMDSTEKNRTLFTLSHLAPSIKRPLTYTPSSCKQTNKQTQTIRQTLHYFAN